MTGLDADFARILDGEASLEETKAFLAASVERMGDPEALAAGARAMRARMIRVNAPEGAIDVCGTGGDGAHTLNISTAVAFVVAGAGVPVAKHGNRAMSSKCGAADVLEALGVKLTADVPTLERCLLEANVAFLFAQNHHPSMRHVAQARRELGHRTIFNLLGPLSNPAGVKRQFLGVFAPEFVGPMAQALHVLGTEQAWVVHGHGGVDELSLSGPPQIAALGDRAIRPVDINIEDLGLAEAIPLSAIAGGAARHNGDALRTLLLDWRSANQNYLTFVVENAGAALAATGNATSIFEGSDRAYESLTSGAAGSAFEKLITLTQAAS